MQLLLEGGLDSVITQGRQGQRATAMVLYERYVDRLVPFTNIQFVSALLL